MYLYYIHCLAEEVKNDAGGALWRCRWCAGFEESVHWYDHLEKHIGWRSLGKILCGYVTQPGDTDGKKELQEAYALGNSIQ